VCTLLAAFGFSKLNIRRKELHFWSLLVALTLPEVVLLTPLFSTAIKLHIYNTLLAVILPLAALQIPFTTLLAVPQFFIGQDNDDLTKEFAAAVLTAIPEVIVYIGLQRLFERGLSAGALR